MEIVHSLQWSNEDKEFASLEKRVAKAWGLDSGVINGLHQKPKYFRVESPNSWSPPPRLVFKLNFDGEARGNPSDEGYARVYRNSFGEIIQVYYGSLEMDTNKFAEL